MTPSPLAALLPLIVLALSFTPQSWAAERLSLDTYLSQVREKNPAVRAAMESTEAGELRAQEGRLLNGPTLYAEGRYKQDQSVQQVNFIPFSWFRTETLNFGVRNTFFWGMSATISNNWVVTQYQDPVVSALFAGSGVNFNLPFHTIYTQLEVTQPLWSNFFGRSTRANQDLLEAQALASSYVNSFTAKSLVRGAEGTYWNMALYRQLVVISKESLDRAQKIYEWNKKRVAMQLADKSDMLQSEALYKARQLEYQGSQDLLKSTARQFNLARGIVSEEVSEELPKIDDSTIAALTIPKRVDMREDVKAAEQQSRASQASAVMSLERDSPTLDLYGTVALYGQGSDLGQSFSNSFGLSKQAHTVGLRFSMALDVPNVLRSRDGWHREREAAELNYQKKLLDQENEWKDMNEQFEAAKSRLVRSTELAVLQKEKLDNGRELQMRGRSTTFQVLQFESDYLNSEMQKLRDQANVLGIQARLKLFSESL